MPCCCCPNNKDFVRRFPAMDTPREYHNIGSCVVFVEEADNNLVAWP